MRTNLEHLSYQLFIYVLFSHRKQCEMETNCYKFHLRSKILFPSPDARRLTIRVCWTWSGTYYLWSLSFWYIIPVTNYYVFSDDDCVWFFRWNKCSIIDRSKERRSTAGHKPFHAQQQDTSHFTLNSRTRAISHSF